MNGFQKAGKVMASLTLVGAGLVLGVVLAGAGAAIANE